MSTISYYEPRFLTSTIAPSARRRSFQSELERLFDLPLHLHSQVENGYAPKLDLYQSAQALTARFELPGVKREDFTVTLEDGTLTISGERREEKSVDEQRSLLNERRSGKFERQIALPAEVDVDRVTAVYQDGVLTVTLPKSEKAKARQIEIK